MVEMRKLVGVVLGLGSLAGLAALLVSRATSSGDGLAVDPPAYRLDGVESNQEYDLSLKFRNGTGRPVRLLGAHETCGSAGCVMITNLPMVVPPGGERVLAVHFRAGQPGGFTKDTPLFTDSPTQPTVLVRVVGRVKRPVPTSAPIVGQPITGLGGQAPIASTGPT